MRRRAVDMGCLLGAVDAVVGEDAARSKHLARLASILLGGASA